MKVTTAQYEALAARIAPLDDEGERAAYLRRDPSIPNIAAAVDLTRRYRWDLFYRAKGWELFADDDSINDSHIETALRRIVPPLSPIAPGFRGSEKKA